MLNHQKRLEDELYTKDQLRTYVDDLKAQHAAVFNRAKSAEQTDEDRRYETLLQCQAQGRSLMLGNTKPEGNMAEGTLHRLVDEGKNIDWHPNWTALLHTEACRDMVNNEHSTLVEEYEIWHTPVICAYILYDKILQHTQMEFRVGASLQPETDAAANPK